MAASWRVFDRIVAGALTAELRKGPGVAAVIVTRSSAHVLGAETSYARMLGIHLSEPKMGDADAIQTLRDAITDALRDARSGRRSAKRVGRHATRRGASPGMCSTTPGRSKTGPTSAAHQTKRRVILVWPQGTIGVNRMRA